MTLYFTLRTKEIGGLEGLRQGYPGIDVEDEYYAALRRCFESIQRRTGKLIDLYDWVEFQGEELDILLEEFEAMKKEIDASFNHITVNLGEQHSPSGTVPLIYDLTPESISLLLQRSIDFARIAKIDGKVFVCKGP